MWRGQDDGSANFTSATSTNKHHEPLKLRLRNWCITSHSSRFCWVKPIPWLHKREYTPLLHTSLFNSNKYVIRYMAREMEPITWIILTVAIFSQLNVDVSEGKDSLHSTRRPLYCQDVINSITKIFHKKKKIRYLYVNCLIWLLAKLFLFYWLCLSLTSP